MYAFLQGIFNSHVIQHYSKICLMLSGYYYPVVPTTEIIALAVQNFVGLIWAKEAKFMMLI